MDRDKRLVIGILVIIGLIIYGTGVSWRTNATNAQSRLPASTVVAPAVLSATPPPSPALADLSPTQPAVLPTAAPPPTAEPTAIAEAPTIPPQTTPELTTMPGPIATAGPSPTSAPPGTPSLTLRAVVQPVAGLTLRAGPGTDYDALAVFLQGAVLEILARTGDGAWVKVRAGGQEGWVASEFLLIEGDITAVPLEGAAEIPPANNCVSVVGDSIAFGEVLFEVPAVGFVKAKMAPFSTYIEQQLALREVFDYPVINRSHPGVGISSPEHTPYYNVPVYSELLRDRCKYTVILPWVNDLSSGLDPAFSAAEHASRLADMAQRLRRNNPEGRILVGNYYPGAPAPFSVKMAYGFTPQAIQLFNQEMAKLCAEGALSTMPEVICIDVNIAFAEIGTSYVVGPMTREEMESFLIAPFTPEEVKMLDYYSSINPQGRLIGDGIHLSSIGKTVLASYITSIILGDALG